MSNIDKAGAVPAKKDGTPQIQIVRPEWLRLPKPGHRCPVSGLCRSYLHTLVRDGKVQTVSIRERGRKRRAPAQHRGAAPGRGAAAPLCGAAT